MSPKKALIILLIIAAVFAAGFFAYYFSSLKSNSENNYDFTGTETETSPAATSSKQVDLKEIIKKNNSAQPLTEDEKAALNQAVGEKAGEKVKAVQEAAKERDYSQNEIDIIANPNKAAEEDLGIKETPVSGTAISGTAAKPLNQEEIDAIANPKP